VLGLRFDKSPISANGVHEATAVLLLLLLPRCSFRGGTLTIAYPPLSLSLSKRSLRALAR